MQKNENIVSSNNVINSITKISENRKEKHYRLARFAIEKRNIEKSFK
ncbi:MAG: hypothetical protein PHR68_04140 [Candidatus Gracilibacteria bacterium]|nr:hypothetical protein [Candidatus Gracilibacteria bacterium]